LTVEQFSISARQDPVCSRRPFKPAQKLPGWLH